ncbi:protein FLX-like 3 isoform X1 [Triticum dicoccoides]|uniref:protein FLX-like 3 isoform X1 n=2 Tax=Triticum dicoccoides TaxID=85692 RepID=UPI000E7BB11E|nr:protein FLX-like 3 isoform X1 [Triticum dicoccoides]XP_037440033.1 protein FLX-like 3 isoform X1 [Triticum dicoccoides]
MSGRDRLPRRFVEDGRGYVDARVAEDRRGHHPGIRVVDDRRGHHEIRVVEDRRTYPAVRVIEDRRAYPEIHERPLMRVAPRSHPDVLEEEIQLHEVDFRRLMADRHALAEERMELHRELQAGKEEVRHLNMIIAEINAKKEAYISELVDKRRKLEAELRSNEPLRDEVVHLRGEIEKLLAVRKELSAKAASLMQELSRERSDKQQLPMLKAEIEGLQLELTHARNACELEQKGNFELVEQRKAMEKSMISMAQEIQQMRAELANFDGRPWGTGGAHGMKLSSPESTFPTQYGDKYNIHVGVSEKGPSHPPESSWGTFEKNRFQYR